MSRTVVVDLDERQAMKLEELLKSVGGREDDVLRTALDQLYERKYERARLKPRSERQKLKRQSYDHER